MECQSIFTDHSLAKIQSLFQKKKMVKCISGTCNWVHINLEINLTQIFFFPSVSITRQQPKFVLRSQICCYHGCDLTKETPGWFGHLTGPGLLDKLTEKFVRDIHNTVKLQRDALFTCNCVFTTCTCGILPGFLVSKYLNQQRIAETRLEQERVLINMQECELINMHILLIWPKYRTDVWGLRLNSRPSNCSN